MEQTQQKAHGGHPYDQWTVQQWERVSAALDLYIRYLLLNLEPGDSPGVTPPPGEQKLVTTILSRIHARTVSSASETEKEDTNGTTIA